MKTIKEPARDIPVRAEADVLVVGGGPAGIMAAEAAAGDGLRVMLVESRGFLGGNLTIGLPILGFLGRKGNQIIEGSAQRFIDRLRARGAASEHRPCKNHMSLTIIDEEEVKRTALEIMEEKGVEVLLYTFFADAIREGDAVKGVVVESKAGREAILAKTVIDCTGDGDVAFRAGVECRKGDAEGGMQPPTLMFSGCATRSSDIPTSTTWTSCRPNSSARANSSPWGCARRSGRRRRPDTVFRWRARSSSRDLPTTRSGST